MKDIKSVIPEVREVLVAFVEDGSVREYPVIAWGLICRLKEVQRPDDVYMDEVYSLRPIVFNVKSKGIDFVTFKYEDFLGLKINGKVYGKSKEENEVE